MSIGYKKISEMISQEIDSIDNFTKSQKEKFKLLCNKIYMLETSTNSVSGSQMIQNIMDEISFTSDRIKELETSSEAN